MTDAQLRKKKKLEERLMATGLFFNLISNHPIILKRHPEFRVRFIWSMDEERWWIDWVMVRYSNKKDSFVYNSVTFEEVFNSVDNETRKCLAFHLDLFQEQV